LRPGGGDTDGGGDRASVWRRVAPSWRSLTLPPVLPVRLRRVETGIHHHIAGKYLAHTRPKWHGAKTIAVSQVHHDCFRRYGRSGVPSVEGVLAEELNAKTLLGQTALPDHRIQSSRLYFMVHVVGGHIHKHHFSADHASVAHVACSPGAVNDKAVGFDDINEAFKCAD